MNITMIGATGKSGKIILEELVRKGHTLTLLVRDPNKVEARGSVSVVEGDVLHKKSLASAMEGADILVSAYGPAPGREEELLEATRNILWAAREFRISRLIALGGAGSLFLPDGSTVAESPELPVEWKPIVQAHIDALEIYRQEKELNWAVMRPQMFFEPGEATGEYRFGTDRLLFDKEGKSRISFGDFAAALGEELEKKSYSRTAFTVGYGKDRVD